MCNIGLSFLRISLYTDQGIPFLDKRLIDELLICDCYFQNLFMEKIRNNINFMRYLTVFRNVFSPNIHFEQLTFMHLFRF